MKHLTSFGLKSAQKLVDEWVDEFNIDLTLDSDSVLAIRIFELVLKFKEEFRNYKKTLIQEGIADNVQLMNIYNKNNERNN